MPKRNGKIFKGDASHLHEETIAHVVEDKDGHLLVGLKGNRGHFLNELIQAFQTSNLPQHVRASGVCFGHGRIETRSATVIAFQTTEKYPYLSTAVRIDRTRIQKRIITCRERFPTR